MTNQSSPLVSIVVITYNSSEYVLETLESAKQQTYQNIELIVTDDCSTDNTVAICHEWLELNKKYFLQTELIVAEHNTGIPANCNRGCKKAQGEFIKIIAGDDILLPNCVEDLVNAIGDNFIIAGLCISFYMDNNGNKILRGKSPRPRKYFIFASSPYLQHKRLLKECFCPACTTFLRRKLFEKVGYYDECYHYFEDYPFWLKCTSAGFKIALLKEVVVQYRTKHDSMVHRKTEIYNTNFYDCQLKFKHERIYPQVPWYNLIFWTVELTKYVSYFYIVKICKNKRSLLTMAIRKCINFCNHLLYGS